MATTSIWSVKGWLGKVVIYVQNPDKTKNPEIAKLPELSGVKEKETQILSDVIAYAVNVEKTRPKGKPEAAEGVDDENEKVMEQYVSGVNCTPTTARSEMMAVKKRYGKDEGIMAFHGYQSFAPGECTPAMAHEIGVKLAEELWGNRFQVIVATHLDKAHHLHNHFVVNSVSFADGLRYHRSNQDYRDMRMASDKLCREYGLSVLEQKKRVRTKHYGEWKAEQEGKPTYKGIVKGDVDDAIRNSRTEKQFYHYLKEKGYSIKIGRDITVRPAGRERGLKISRNFGKEYTIEAIRRRILLQSEKMPNNYSAVSAGKSRKIYAVKKCSGCRRTKKIQGLRGMYLRYCYLLGILPKNRPAKPPGEMHFLLREDLIKLNTISKETELLCHHRIDTAEQLFSMKKELKAQMEELVNERRSLRTRSRNIRDKGELASTKARISELTGRIGELRKELKLCDGIAVRSKVIEQKMETIRRDRLKEKEENSYEHVRRSR